VELRLERAKLEWLFFFDIEVVQRFDGVICIFGVRWLGFFGW
jgi:hypothetical protein